MFKQYYTALCHYANSYLKDKAVAEDLVSETFALLWKDKSKLKKASNPKAYLYKAIHNNCLNYLRQQKKQQGNSELTCELIENTPSRDNNAINSIIIEEVSTQIKKAIHDLPPQQQKVIALKRIHQKKNKEIAEELNLAIKTVEMHIAKAQETLRAKLRGLR